MGISAPEKMQKPTSEAELMEEYKMLRAEIMNCINLQNTLSTFMVSAVGVILTFSFVYQQPLLFLLPFAVIIPLQCRVFHYRQNMMKISAYMVTFLEPALPGICWETRHKNLSEIKEPVLIRGCRNYEGALLALACFVLLAVYSAAVYGLPQIFAHGQISAALLCVAALATIYAFYLSVKTNQSAKTRELYIRQWEQVENS